MTLLHTSLAACSFQLAQHSETSLQDIPMSGSHETVVRPLLHILYDPCV
jgi:hypothetical protein